MNISQDNLDEFYKKIAENVQKKRIDHGKTQRDIAYEALGLDRDNFVSKLENNAEGKHFNLTQLFKIAKYLKCDIKDFFRGINNE